jgi:YggT family protein
MGGLIVLALELFLLMLLGRALLSWVRIGPGHALYPVARFLDAITEPVVAPVRRIMPRSGAFDFSLTVVMLVIAFVLLPIASQL